MKNILIAALLLPALAASCTTRAPGPTVILVVRHAEKAVGGDDPPLTDAGGRRAQALAQVAEDAKIAAIYTSQFIRNRDTAKPLSDKAGVPITEVPVNLQQPGDYGLQLGKLVLEKHPGEYVVIVSHQNTVPAIVEGLSGQSVPPLKDTEYASLFIVVVPADGTPRRLIRAQYGQPDGI